MSKYRVTVKVNGTILDKLFTDEESAQSYASKMARNLVEPETTITIRGSLIGRDRAILFR